MKAASVSVGKQAMIHATNGVIYKKCEEGKSFTILHSKHNSCGNAAYRNGSGATDFGLQAVLQRVGHFQIYGGAGCLAPSSRAHSTHSSRVTHTAAQQHSTEVKTACKSFEKYRPSFGFPLVRSPTCLNSSRNLVLTMQHSLKDEGLHFALTSLRQLDLWNSHRQAPHLPDYSISHYLFSY